MPILTWLYRRLGHRYPGAFLILELQTALPIAAGTLALFAYYYGASWAEYGQVLALLVGLIVLSSVVAIIRGLARLRPITEWIRGRRDQEATAEAWTAAVGVPLAMLRHDLALPVFTLVIPATVAVTWTFELAWTAGIPIFFGSMIALAYAGILHYLALETGMRPVLMDINREVSPRFKTDCSTLPLRVRLMAALPLINVITGLTVAALTGGGEAASLGFDVLVAVGVAATISLELTILLSRTILRPLGDIQSAVQAISRGDYSTAIPVTTGDELGELAASVNAMMRGLRDRERVREAFGTYLDREVADYILSDSFVEGGEEVEVSVLFCDVREFTRFAAGVGAHEVVARLNELFEVVVPIIARHGGHVDKFEGDGLMAVFGAPKAFDDHADRAVRAGCEINRRVNQLGEGGPLELGIGVNTGTVVAGSIGGGGRLNFSVIGDPVNVAARVEAETRRLGDAMLITAATRQRLSGERELASRGAHRLKGIDEPIELFAPLASSNAMAERQSERPTASV